MIVTCSNCSTRLQLDKAKIPARPFSVRCPKCQQIVNAQPPVPQAQRDALSAVTDVPVSSRSQQEMTATPAAPLPRETAANRREMITAGRETVPSTREPDEGGDMLRMLASLLRREAGESAGSKSTGRRAWESRRVLVCAGSAYATEVAHVLAEDGCVVLIAGDKDEAAERMREEHVDIVVLDPEFDVRAQGATFISHEIGSLRMPERRRIIFVQLSDKVRTGDAHAAFLANANLVVNTSDAAELPRALEKNVRDLNELYRDFNKALGLAEF